MIKVCAFRGCEERFTPARKNQKYHTPECCKLEMNARAKDAWAEKKGRSGKVRKCTVCSTKLNSYNSGTICGACQERARQESRRRAFKILNGE